MKQQQIKHFVFESTHLKRKINYGYQCVEFEKIISGSDPDKKFEGNSGS